MSRVAMVPVNEITPAPFNPVSRSDPSSLRALRRDIEENGILYPILVLDKGKRSKYPLVDGAGRLSIAKDLGHEAVPVVIVNTQSQARLFSRQFLSRRLTSRQQLQVFIKAPTALLPVSRRRADRAIELFGKAAIKDFADRGASLITFTEARQADEYLLPIKDFTDRPERTRQTKIVRWILKFRAHRQLKRGMQTGIPPATLWRAISEDRALPPIEQ